MRGIGRLCAMCATTMALLAMGAGVAAANHSAKDHVSIGPTGGNGAFDVYFDATSADGSRVFFDTDEKLASTDTDANFDVYERRGGTTTLISTGPNGGNGAFDVFFAGASADGTRVFFETDEKLVTGPGGDSDSFFDVYERFAGTTTLVSTGTTGGNGAFDVTFHDISRDGTRVFFETDEQLTGTDMDTQTDIYERAGGTTSQVSLGPNGGNGPFFVAFGGISDDGTHVFFETDEQLVTGPGGDSDSFYDVYERTGGTTSRISAGPPGGNANIDAGYRGNSADGSRVFFQTAEVLDVADGDSQTDVYERSGGSSTLRSIGPTGGNAAIPTAFEGASASGTRVFFSTTESLTSNDMDGRRDIYRREGGTTDLVSPTTGSGGGAFDADFMGISLDGSNAYVRTEEALLPSDTDGGCAAGQGPGCRDIYEWSGGTTTTQVSTGGSQGSFDAGFATVSLDGERVFFDTRESLSGSDMDAAVDVYERFNNTTTHISGGPAGGNGAFAAFLFPNGLSDDGTRAFFDTAESLMTSDTDTSFDVYVATVAGYPRPVGATPLRVSLVPAFTACSSPNRTHGPPLAFGSCNPPAQTSAQASVGTPDAFGGPANFVGSIRLGVVAGIPSPPDDSNVLINVSLVDVRCHPTGARCGTANAGGPADYNGELRTDFALKMTDRWNATAPGGGPDAATGSTSLGTSIPCTQTASTSTGSSCTLSTSALALVPGSVKDTKRAIWELGQVQVHDGGADGDGDTPAGNTLFAVQGIFIP